VNTQKVEDKAKAMEMLLKGPDDDRKKEMLRSLGSIVIKNERHVKTRDGSYRPVHCQIFPMGKQWQKLYYTNSDLTLCEITGDAMACHACNHYRNGTCQAEPQWLRDSELLALLEKVSWEVKHKVRRGRLRFYIQIIPGKIKLRKRSKSAYQAVIQPLDTGQLAFSNFLGREVQPC